MSRFLLVLAVVILAALVLRAPNPHALEVRTEPVTAAVSARPTLAVIEPTTTTTQPPTTTTTHPPSPPTTQALTPSAKATGASGDPNNDASWDRLAQCESGGDWHIATGNGYWGGLQFSLSSWRAVGGTGYPHEHSREEQIHRGRLLWAQGGWAHWPGCTRSFGWR